MCLTGPGDGAPGVMLPARGAGGGGFGGVKLQLGVSSQRLVPVRASGGTQIHVWVAESAVQRLEAWGSGGLPLSSSLLVLGYMPHGYMT